MSDDNIARVHYFNQQFLRTQDFSDEQAYHIEMRRRHNIAHHEWGIVHGLDILLDDSGIFIQAGVSIDGYGRELILARRIAVPDSAFTANNSNEIDVALVYNRSGSDQSPSRRQICNEKVASEYYRWQEVPVLRVFKHQPGVNWRKPAAVPPADHQFPAFGTPPDDPKQDWPVFLGTIKRDLTDPDNPSFIIERAGRPAAGLVGDKITTPNSSAQLLFQSAISSQIDNNPVISNSELSVRLKNSQQQWQTFVNVKDSGQIELTGNTNIRGNLTMDRGAVQFDHTNKVIIDSDQQNSPQNNAKGNNVSQVPAPKPWSIYKVEQTVNEDGVPVTTQQLRIELPTLGQENASDSAKKQVVIGAWSPENEGFEPILTVGNVNHPDGEPAVTVHGDLIVKGAIKRSEPTINRNFTTEAKDFLVGTYSSGVAGANTQLSQQYTSPFDGNKCDITDANIRQNIVDQLVDPDTDVKHLDQFLELLLKEQVARDLTIQKLVDDPTWLPDVIDAVVAKDTSGTALKVIKAPGGATAIGQHLTTLATTGEPVFLEDVLTPVLAVPEPRNIVAEQIVEQDGGPVSIGLKIADKPVELNALVKAVLEAPHGEAKANMAEAVMRELSGRSAIGDNLVIHHQQRMEDVIDPVLKDEDARETLVNLVVSDQPDQDNLNPVGDYLVNNNEYIDNVIKPVLEDDSENGSREVLYNIILQDNIQAVVGEVLDYEESGEATGPFNILLTLDNARVNDAPPNRFTVFKQELDEFHTDDAFKLALCAPLEQPSP